MVRWIFILMSVVILGLGAAACGPAPTPEVVEKVVKETVVVEKEMEVTKEVEVVVTPTPLPPPEEVVEPVVVTFMSWAEDDFEVWALQELVSRFEEAYPGIKVDAEIVTAEGVGQ